MLQLSTHNVFLLKPNLHTVIKAEARLNSTSARNPAVQIPNHNKLCFRQMVTWSMTSEIRLVNRYLISVLCNIFHILGLIITSMSPHSSSFSTVFHKLDVSSSRIKILLAL